MAVLPELYRKWYIGFQKLNTPQGALMVFPNADWGLPGSGGSATEPQPTPVPDPNPVPDVPVVTPPGQGDSYWDSADYALALRDNAAQLAWYTYYQKCNDYWAWVRGQKGVC